MIRVFSLDYAVSSDGIWYPADKELHKLAVAYAEEKLLEMPVFPDFKKAWAACRVDEETGKPVEVIGLLGMVFKADIPMLRTDNGQAMIALHHRCEAWLHDAGMRGAEVFIYVRTDEAAEHQCANARQWLEAFEAVPAERYRVIVK